MKMKKEGYRIKEISRLFGIGADSLRYYEELGILKPRRAANGYRLYGMNDIYRLNVVKDLRQFDFPMKRIKEYLDQKNLASTLSLLEEESRLMEREIRELQEKTRSIRERIEELAGYESVRADTIALVRMRERHCIALDADVSSDEEIDFALSKLHQRFEHKMHALGNYLIGARQRMSDIDAGVYGLFRMVFFILEKDAPEYDFSIPAGDYLSLHYRGSSERSTECILKLLAHAHASGYDIAGDPFELYKIDIHETNVREEFLTEVQVRVEKKSRRSPQAIGAILGTFLFSGRDALYAL